MIYEKDGWDLAKPVSSFSWLWNETWKASHSFVCLFITAKFKIEDDKRLHELTLNFQVDTGLFKLHFYPPLSFILHHVHVLPQQRAMQNRKTSRQPVQGCRFESGKPASIIRSNNVNGRSQWPCGLRRGSWPVGCWDRGFESRLRHRCLSLVFLCCVVLCR
jgi:hypothetical protein